MDPTSIETMLADDRFVRRLARRLVRDGASADDVAQAVYVEALESEPDASSPRGWIATVVRNVASNLRRGEGRRARHERAAARSEAQPPESALIEREEVRRKLVAAVLRLGPPRSTIVVLRYFEEMPPRAIATRLDMPIETVRTHLKRAHAELRARLGSDRLGDGSSVFAGLPLLLVTPRLGPQAMGIALMTAKTKIALCVLAAVLATWTWIAIRPLDVADSPASRPPPGALPVVVATEPDRAVLDAPAPREAERAPLESRRDAAASAPSAVVPSGGILRGIVLDADGAPAEGVLVQGGRAPAANLNEGSILEALMRPDLGVPADGPRADGGFFVRSRPDGTFELDGLPPHDAYDLAASSTAHGVVLVSGVPVRAAEPAQVTLRFERGIVLYGEVTNEVGEPVVGAHVQVMGTKDGDRYSSLLWIEVAPDGSWRTPPIARSGAHLTAEGPGFLDQRRHLTLDPDHEREIRADFRLAPAVELRGRFVRADGTPARLASGLERRGITPHGREVALLGSYDDPTGDRNFRGIGHAEGAIEWDEDRWHLMPSDPTPLYISLWCGSTMLGVVGPVSSADADLVVDLERLPSAPAQRPVRVRIVDEVRAPITDAAARIHAAFETLGGHEYSFQALAVDEHAPGVLHAESVAVGAHELRITAPGFVARRIALDVAQGEGAVEVDVAMLRADRRITVVARKTSGEAVEGARLFVLDADGRPVDRRSSIATNIEGRAEIDGLGAGEFTVVASHERLGAAGRRVRIADSLGEVAITLADGIEVAIETPGADGPFSFRATDAAGVVVLEDETIGGRRFGSGFKLKLAPGRHTVSVRCPGFQPGEAIVDVAPGAKARIELKPLAK